MRLIFSCEHGGNRVPAAYRHCFAAAAPVLNSHRGYDPGSLEFARRMSRELAAPLFASQVTRLLVELNRSIGHPGLFSEYTRCLDRAEKDTILARYYFPHRRLLEAAVAKEDRVLHIGVHSFTPILDGEVRRADIGLLYDPARTRERSMCIAWQKQITGQFPDLIVRRNYPYLGKADGFTTALRRRFPPDRYLGIELEVNQHWNERPQRDRRQLARLLTDSLVAAIAFIQERGLARSQ